MANNVLDRMADFKKGIHETMLSVASDISRVGNVLDGTGKGAASRGLGEEKSSRLSGRGSRPTEVTVNVPVMLDSQEMKSFSRKAVVENFSDNL